MAGTEDHPAGPPPDAVDPDITDPELLSANSSFKSYTTSRYTYPSLRVFYRQHPKADELPTIPGPLPLLVLCHGLGGSVAQFHPLLSSLVDLATCLAIDLPGCGRSKYELAAWDAYRPEALCELLETVIDDHRDKERKQTVVLIGHSMGAAFSAYLANRKVRHYTNLAQYVVGLLGICPPAGPVDEKMTIWARRLLWMPGWLFDLWRTWDGWGGPHSASVARFVGENPEPELKMLQYRYNKQSRTPVWRRMAWGSLAKYENGKAVGGMPGLDVWAGLSIPVYLIAGQNDHLTPITQMDKILEALLAQDAEAAQSSKQQADLTVDTTAAPLVEASGKLADHAPTSNNGISLQLDTSPTEDDHNIDVHQDPSTPVESPVCIPSQPRHPSRIVDSKVLPAPATHALLYQPRSVRVLAGLISDFLTSHITGRLSLAWQLQHLSREGKWDVKNLAKWRSVPPVSDPIPSSKPPAIGSGKKTTSNGSPQRKPIFRAMKTLREADDIHTPEAFVTDWGQEIKDIIDITKDQPVYDPHTLNRAGIHYHKFPTVSKIPPQNHEVEKFIRLVDSLREKQQERASEEGWNLPGGTTNAESSEVSGPLIAVHCHYGFNRTGYFVVCYLVERCGFSVQEAIAEFARGRPNGIRHSHFLDRLCVRYNLERSDIAS